MSQSIGKNIRKLRKERDLTQERLAELLNVTAQAISKWENETGMPDISQIPALCHVFGVSSDVLLGIDIERNNEQIKEYLDTARNFCHQGKWEEYTAILREANKKFPRDYRIMQTLADAIVNEYSRKGIKEYDEVFDLCQRVLAECTDSNIRYEAIETLGIAYDYAGKQEEMLKLAKEMPHTHFSYENFMMYRWKGDTDFEEFQGYLSFLIVSTAEMIELAVCQKHDNGAFIYPLEDRIHLWETAVSLLELLFPSGDYQSKAQLGEIACSFLCTANLRKGNHEQTWRWLEKGADFAIHMDTYDFDAPHTSPILRGYSDGGWIMEAEGNRSQSLLRWLTTDEEATALRDDPRYDELVNRLKKVAKKP